jgi:hypothetical protein
MRFYGAVATLQDTGNIQVTGLEYGRDRKINIKLEGVSPFFKKDPDRKTFMSRKVD